MFLVMMLFHSICVMAGGTFHLKVGDTETLSFTPHDGILTNTVRWESNCPQQVVVTKNIGTTAWIEIAAPLGGSYAIVQCRYEYVVYNGNFPSYRTAAEDFNIYVEPSEPTGISLRNSLTLAVGESATLTPTVDPADAVTQLSWTTNNGTVASVSQNGRVSGVSAGTARITVRTDNGLSASCNVTVEGERPAPTSISISGTLSLNAGQSATLTPVLYPQNAATEFTWSTDNNTIATVSPNGKVSAISIGETRITVTTSNGLSAACTVKVSKNDSDISGGEFAGGQGTASNPYLIATAEHLSHIEDYKNKYFKQTGDIDLETLPGGSSKGWLPIGANYDPFTGSFDGNGFSITGLKIERPDRDFVGLFGYAKNATIKNVVVDGSEVTGKNQCAAVVGYAEECTIQHVQVSGQVSGTDCTGGIAGRIKNTTISDGNFSGHVNGNDKTGGIIGHWEYDKAAEAHSYTLEGGRWVSESKKAFNIQDLAFDGSVAGNISVGGIVGEISGENSASAQMQSGTTGTYVLNGIANINLQKLLSIGNVDGQENTGGIIGNLQTTATSESGGFQGQVYEILSGTYQTVILSSQVNSEIGIKISDCHNTAIITGGKNSGGIMGRIEMKRHLSTLGIFPALSDPTANTHYSIEKCTSNGNVIASGDYAGGIVGWSDVSGTSDKSYVRNTSCSPETVSAGNHAGGLVGHAANLHVENSMFTGKGITASGHVAAGIMASSSQSASVKSCFSAAAEITAADSVCRIGFASEYENNGGAENTILRTNGTDINAEDDPQTNGSSIPAEELKLGNTYYSTGWDLATTWKIKEEESYPFLRTQTEPLTNDITYTKNSENLFASGRSGSKEGYAFAQINGKIYRGEIRTDGNWTITMPLDACTIGDELQLFGKDSGNAPSYSIFTRVDDIGETGIEDMKADSFSATCTNGILHIRNAEHGSNLSVYNTAGTILAQEIVREKDMDVTVGDIHSVLIVRCGNHTVKVINND